MIGYAVIAAGLGGYSVSKNLGTALVAFAFAVLCGSAGWWMAAMPPSEKELADQRKHLQERIAKLQNRLP